MYIEENYETPIIFLDEFQGNKIYCKREDLYPFSFGGNKARKGMLFWKDILKNNGDYIVTYGSSSSNHCRIIANIASSNKIPCCIISPEEQKKYTFNSKMMEKFGAQIKFCKFSEVNDTIHQTLDDLKKKGFNPYFVQGGGHGNIGTEAYVHCFEEIKKYEMRNDISFDYIFHASGTGTTQSGLVCGKLINNSTNNIVGISIARKLPYGRNVVIDSVKKYLNENKMTNIIQNMDETKNVVFEDKYVVDGYGTFNSEIESVIDKVMSKYGIPLDRTYTGKAFWGMEQYILENNLKEKNILFIHTGGTPLFFDDMEIK